MIGLVLDTNVLVSALLNDKGLERRVLQLVLSKKLVWYVSDAILAEYQEVLRRRKFSIDADRVDQTLAQIAKVSVLISPEFRLAVCSDESDNRFLECAEEAGANFLVTGNKRHFPRSWKSTAVVNARELIELAPAILKV